MGQYHIVCNLDRKEYLNPHAFNDGIKLMEFGSSGPGTMTALAILLAVSNGRGGGDIRVDDDKAQTYIVGRWGGDRIAIIGDYHAEDDIAGFTDIQVSDTGAWNPDTQEYDLPVYGDVPWNQSKNLDLGWTDISRVVRDVLCQDSYLNQSLGERDYEWSSYGWVGVLRESGQIERVPEPEEER